MILRRLGVVIFALAVIGCGGGDGDSEGASVTTASGPTTTVVTEESLIAGMCGLDLKGAPEADTAARYRFIVDAYEKLVPPPSLQAQFAEVIAAYKANAALWSEATPTTAAEWSKRLDALNVRTREANKPFEGRCPPPSDSSTTVADPPRAAVQVGAVDHETSNRGLYWYILFTCAEGKQVKPLDGFEPVKDQPDLFTIYDPEAGAASPFTGVVANQSWGRIYTKVGANCV